MNAVAHSLTATLTLGAQSIYDVLIALIYGVPAIVAAVCTAVITVRTRMPNGAKLGETVAAAGQHAADTNERVRRLEDGLENGT